VLLPSICRFCSRMRAACTVQTSCCPVCQPPHAHPRMYSQPHYWDICGSHSTTPRGRVSVSNYLMHMARLRGCPGLPDVTIRWEVQNGIKQLFSNRPGLLLSAGVTTEGQALVSASPGSKPDILDWLSSQ
jgi:hypothetical protein